MQRKAFFETLDMDSGLEEDSGGFYLADLLASSNFVLKLNQVIPG